MLYSSQSNYNHLCMCTHHFHSVHVTHKNLFGGKKFFPLHMDCALYYTFALKVLLVSFKLSYNYLPYTKSSGYINSIVSDVYPKTM